MTNQEAIDYLKGVRKTIELETVCPFGYYSDSVPYINQAIKALEREETCENIYKGVLGFECSNCHYIEKISVSYNYCPNCGRRVAKEEAE